jgi:very-short-patch-repair endonuclease
MRRIQGGAGGWGVSASFDQRIATVALPQGGHITRTQLLGLGLTCRQIDYRVRIGRLINVHRGVYAVGVLPSNPIDRARGALLAAGPHSALARWSAAAYWGLARNWPTTVELVSAADRRHRAIRIEVSERLLGRDIRKIDGLRVTSPARTLLDTAPKMTSKRLTRAINDLRHDRKLTLPQLRDVVARNPRHSGSKPLKSVLEISQPEPTRSELEDAFLALLRKHRLPTPEVNVEVAGYLVDAYFPDHQLIVELDGWLTHQTKHAFTRDRRQDAEILGRTGISTIRLTYQQTKQTGTRTAQDLAAILARRARD